MVDARDAAIGCIDQLTVHRHPDMRMCVRKACEGCGQQSGDNIAKRSEHARDHNMDCGAKVTCNTVCR